MTREGTKPHVLLTKGWGFHIAGFWQGESKTSATRVGGSISSRKRKARSGREVLIVELLLVKLKLGRLLTLTLGSRDQVNVVPPSSTVHLGLSLNDIPHER